MCPAMKYSSLYESDSRSVHDPGDGIITSFYALVKTEMERGRRGERGFVLEVTGKHGYCKFASCIIVEKAFIGARRGKRGMKYEAILSTMSIRMNQA